MDWNERKNKRHWAAKGAMLLGMLIVAVLAFGYATMALWNWLIPSIFGLRAITFWQAIGLLVLSKILFSGFRGRGRRGGGPWRHKMRARWQQMTPEERERFRAGMRSRGGWCSGGRMGDRFNPGDNTAAEKGA